MNANHFRIVSVSVAVFTDEADDIAEQLEGISSNFGIYSLGTTQRVPNRKELSMIKDQVPDEVLNGHYDYKRPGLGEQQRRDEKRGTYPGMEDVAN